MMFSTRKMVIATILVAILLALFLGFAFDSIQKVTTSVEIINNGSIDPELEKIADIIISKFTVPYVDGISLEDTGMDILLVNHQRKAACLITKQGKFAVHYAKLDQSVVSCNQYLMIVNRRETMVINCDEILGDAVVRTITNAYKYAFTSTEMLNPSSIEYFPTLNQNESISFYRYGMIESAKQYYFEDAGLNDFHYFYDQWIHAQGINIYQEVIHYDYYDGFNAYVRAKVLADIENDFNLQEYITRYRNDYGIYTKDQESGIMGMLWCFIMEDRGEKVIVDQAETQNMYRGLLDGIPLGHVDDETLKSQYHQGFEDYMDSITEAVEHYKDDVQNKKAVVPALTAEAYGETIKIDKDYYIYLNYSARKSNNDLIVLDGVLAKVTSFAITLFMDAE